MKAISFLLFLLYSTASLAQQTMWSGRAEITANLNLPYKLECAFSVQSRLTHEFTAFDGMYYYIEPSWSLPHNFKIETEYRHRQRNGMHQNRFRFGVSKKWDFGKLSMAARIHAQFAAMYLDPDFLDLYPVQNRIRPRLLLAYKLNKKWSSSLSAESFISRQEYIWSVQRMRYRFQVTRDMGKKKNLSVALFYQPIYGLPYASTDFVVLANYSFQLGKIKKSKSKKETDHAG